MLQVFQGLKLVFVMLQYRNGYHRCVQDVKIRYNTKFDVNPRSGRFSNNSGTKRYWLDHVLVEKIAQLDQAGACPWPGCGQSVGLRPVLDMVKPAGQQASITDLKGWRHGHLWGPYRPCYAGVQLRLARASATAIATVAVLHGGDYPDQWGW